MSDEIDYGSIPNFMFFRSFYEAIDLLEDDNEKLQAYQTIVRYGFTGVLELEQLPLTVKMIVIMAIPNVDNSLKCVWSGIISKTRDSPKKTAPKGSSEGAKKGSKKTAPKGSSEGAKKEVSNEAKPRGLEKGATPARGEERRGDGEEKEGIGEEMEGRTAPPLSTEPHSDLDSRSICQNFNTICYKLEQMEVLSPKQTTSTKLFLETYGEDKLLQLFHLANESDFLCGSKEFKADYSWIIKLENAEKIFSGKYANNEKKPTSSGGSAFIQYAEEQLNLATQSKGTPDGINTIQPQAP